MKNFNIASWRNFLKHMADRLHSLPLYLGYRPILRHPRLILHRPLLRWLDDRWVWC